MLKVVGVDRATSAPVIANGTSSTWNGCRSRPRQSRRELARQLRLGAGARAGRGDVRAPRRLLVRQRPEDLHRVDDGGGVGQGQIWVYDPHRETIALLFQSPGAAVLNAPDNITVSPRGGLVLCEDGSGEEFLHGLTVDGEIFQFAKNNVVLNGERNGIAGDFRGSEFAGACYSPDGNWLFVNMQTPGITFAITGPWQTGAL